MTYRCRLVAIKNANFKVIGFEFRNRHVLVMGDEVKHVMFKINYFVIARNKEAIPSVTDGYINIIKPSTNCSKAG